MPQVVLTRPEDLQAGQSDVICMFPQWFVPRQWRAPRGAVFCGFPRTSDQPLPHYITEFLATGERPIVFDLRGDAENAQKWTAVVRRAAQNLARRAIVAGIDGANESNVLFVNDIAADRVALLACAVVHGGDSRVAGAALAASVPQLIVGRGRWAKQLGLRLRELGVARRIPAALARSRASVAVLRQLLRDPKVARRCAALAEEVRRQDADEAMRRALDPARRVVSMSLIGRFGQFGNQVLQYAFLKVVARNNGYEPQCTAWSGEDIFGYRDARLTRLLPPAIEKTDGPNLFDAFPELRRYVEYQAGAESIRVGPEALQSCPPNVDLCGHFMFHTSVLAPHKEFVRSLFVPSDDIKRPLDEALAKMRERGKTIIGIQVRRGDFLASPISTFTFAVPPAWWKQWLRRIWDSSARPVLYVASDDASFILRELAEFSPVTAKDLGVLLPEHAREQSFFIDHYVLSHCDVLGISNSTFGFTACMLNARARVFARASLTAPEHFVEFDPWNAEPLLHFGKRPTRKTLAQMASITYRTQGLGQTLKCLGYYLPRALLRGMLVRGYLAQQAEGWGGAVASAARMATAPLR